MADNLKLPVGVDSFEKIRRNRFYYIDKTKLIEQLVEMGGEVTLFTRPRRFGKTLNMSMLRSFFEIGADALLFEGLYIAKNKSLCEAQMGHFSFAQERGRINFRKCKVPMNRTGIIIELKYAEDGNLDAACDEALRQIEEKDYTAKLKQDGMINFIKYGIACYKKFSKVVIGE